MESKQEYYKITAEKIIKEFEKRNIKGLYFATKEEALEAVLDMVPDNATVGWGGSMTMEEMGLKDALRQGPYHCLDRDNAKDPDEQKRLFREAFSADYFFLSSNAVTMDGKLVNIDGRGTRLAAFIYGPDNVVVVAGMNKVVIDEEAALKRVKNYASPINCLRLERDTPCAQTGACSECQSPDCICSQTVITRRSHIDNRMIVVLIGEELGY